MEHPHRYEIAGGFRWPMLGFSYLVLIGLVAAAALVLGPGGAEREDVVTLVLCGVLFGGMALYGLWVGHRPEHYAVEMIPEGIIRPATGRMIPWSSIARLRERAILQRVDLIDHAGATVASLEYQLARFEQALRDTVESCRVAFPRAALPASFEGPTVLRRPAAVSVLLTTESVVLRDGSKQRRFPLSEVADVRLALVSLGQGNRGLRLFLVLADGSAVQIPEGVVPFPVYAAIRDALKGWRGETR